MIFRPDLIQQILAGRKTMTRRLFKDGDNLRWMGVPRSFEVSGKHVWVEDVRGYDRWVSGRIYAVQPGRGKKGVATIELLDIWRESLWQITQEDVIREGLASIADFTRIWNLLHPPGKRWEDNPLVWVLIFALRGKE